jgi:hypothetical protein
MTPPSPELPRKSQYRGCFRWSYPVTTDRRRTGSNPAAPGPEQRPRGSGPLLVLAWGQLLSRRAHTAGGVGYGTESPAAPQGGSRGDDDLAASNRGAARSPRTTWRSDGVASQHPTLQPRAASLTRRRGALLPSVGRDLGQAGYDSVMAPSSRPRGGSSQSSQGWRTQPTALRCTKGSPWTNVPRNESRRDSRCGWLCTATPHRERLVPRSVVSARPPCRATCARPRSCSPPSW